MAKVGHPCATLCIGWGSFFALLPVDGQEVHFLDFTSGKFCCPPIFLFVRIKASSDVFIGSSAGCYILENMS